MTEGKTLLEVCCADVESVRLYESYLGTFRIKAGGFS